MPGLPQGLSAAGGAAPLCLGMLKSRRTPSALTQTRTMHAPPTRRALLLACLCLPWAAAAQDAPLLVEGQPFQRRVRLAGVELLLNGTGVRAVAWFKGYAAGLYLSSRARTAAQAVAMAGPKRLQLRMLKEVPAQEFVKAFDKGVKRNASAEELPQLSARMARFAALIQGLGTVHDGDVVDLDYDPAQGLSFLLNGTLRGAPIAGEDFYAALLRSFVGDKPYDAKLKAGLLGA